MNKKLIEKLKEITKDMSPDLIEKVIDYADFLKYNESKKREFENITEEEKKKI